jgi:ribosomal protein S18 acetylase RimI-like enzyme
MTNENIVSSAVSCKLMEASHVDEVALLFVRRFQLTPRELSDDEVKRGESFAQQRALIEARLGSLGKGAAVACRNGTVAGFILFRIAATGIGHHALQLEWIARDARMERLGVASTLVGWLINFVKGEPRERPIKSVFLIVNMMNEAAVRCYHRLGFRSREKENDPCDLEDSMLVCMELII